MAPSSTETRVGFESWCKDRYYFLKTKKTTEYFPSQTFISGTAGRNIGKFFSARIPEIQDFGYFCKNCKDYENKQFDDVCAGCIDSLRYRSEAECPYARRNGRADRIEDAGSKMGLTINEALAARSSSRDFSPEMLSLEELRVYCGCCRGKPGGWASYRAFGYGALSHSSMLSCLKVCIVTIRKRMY